MPKVREIPRGSQISANGSEVPINSNVSGVMVTPAPRMDRMRRGEVFPSRDGIRDVNSDIACHAIRSLVDYIQEGGRPKDVSQVLATADRLSISGIASTTGMSVEAVRYELNRLGDAGLIERHYDPDGYEGPLYSLRVPLVPMRPPSRRN